MVHFGIVERMVVLEKAAGRLTVVGAVGCRGREISIQVRLLWYKGCRGVALAERGEGTRTGGLR